MEVRKRRVVSGKSHPLVVGNLKSVFADFQIFQGKGCACDAVERVSQLNRKLGQERRQAQRTAGRALARE